jgi:hypothetical protein
MNANKTKLKEQEAKNEQSHLDEEIENNTLAQKEDANGTNKQSKLDSLRHRLNRDLHKDLGNEYSINDRLNGDWTIEDIVLQNRKQSELSNILSLLISIWSTRKCGSQRNSILLSGR